MLVVQGCQRPVRRPDDHRLKARWPDRVQMIDVANAGHAVLFPSSQAGRRRDLRFRLSAQLTHRPCIRPPTGRRTPRRRDAERQRVEHLIVHAELLPGLKDRMRPGTWFISPRSQQPSKPMIPSQSRVVNRTLSEGDCASVFRWLREWMRSAAPLAGLSNGQNRKRFTHADPATVSATARVVTTSPPEASPSALAAIVTPRPRVSSPTSATSETWTPACSSYLARSSSQARSPRAVFCTVEPTMSVKMAKTRHRARVTARGHRTGEMSLDLVDDDVVRDRP